MIQIDIDKLHQTHFSPVTRRSGQTTYAVAEIEGYMALLEKQNIYVVLNNKKAARMFERMFIGYWCEQLDNHVYGSAYLMVDQKTGNKLHFIDQMEFIQIISRQSAKDYVIFDQSIFN